MNKPDCDIVFCISSDMKKQVVRFLIPGIAVLAIFLAGCSQSPFCQGEDKNKGLISDEAEISCQPRKGTQFVITTDSAYRQTFNDNDTTSTCNLPEIDFNTHTLLGLYATGGCVIKFIREVTEKDNGYHYKVIIRDCGMCKRMGFSYNWVLVPKLPAGPRWLFQQPVCCGLRR